MFLIARRIICTSSHQEFWAFIGRDPKAQKHNGIHQRSNKSLLLVTKTTLLIFLWKYIISLSQSSFSKLHTVVDIEMCIHLLFPEISQEKLLHQAFVGYEFSPMHTFAYHSWTSGIIECFCPCLVVNCMSYKPNFNMDFLIEIFFKEHLHQ